MAKIEGYLDRQLEIRKTVCFKAAIALHQERLGSLDYPANRDELVKSVFDLTQRFIDGWDTVRTNRVVIA